NKKLPADIATRIRQSLKAIKASGQYQALLNKWQLTLSAY
ncbi:amino acid ABC transporter substrate-binding protein, partial [Pseudoalteromonas ruthenica]